MTKIIAPSVLSADFTNLGKDIEMLNNSKAEWIHFDVMDGVYVPNISFGFPVLKAIRKNTTKFIDVHLMISKPEDYIEEFKKAGADGISVHWEGNTHIHSIIAKIKDNGMKAGIVLNPATSVSTVKDLLNDLDLLLIMSVNPGFGGQKFLENTYNKVKEAKELINKIGSKTLIQVDGGVSPLNSKRLFELGANVLVAGSAVFKSENPKATIHEMLK